jgi:hypothetical protein
LAQAATLPGHSRHTFLSHILNPPFSLLCRSMHRIFLVILLATSGADAAHLRMTKVQTNLESGLARAAQDQVCLLQAELLIDPSKSGRRISRLHRRALKDAPSQNIIALKNDEGEPPEHGNCTSDSDHWLKDDTWAADILGSSMKNESIIQRYKVEGKISASGFPKLNFVHIPKTGGASFKLASATLGEFQMAGRNPRYKTRLQDFGPDLQTAENCFFTQMPALDLGYEIAKAIYGESEIFCSIRDPIEKLISGACHLSNSPEFNRFKEAVKLPHYTNAGFLRWMLDTYAGGSRHEYTCFMIPQVDYLKGEFGCKHVIDFDHITSDHAKLMHEFGMDEIKLPLANQTHRCKQKCDLSREDIPADTIELIEKMYAEDIAFHKEFKKKNRHPLNIAEPSQNNRFAYD